MTDTDRLDLEPELANAPPLASAVGEFRSILFGGEDIDRAAGEEPAFFACQDESASSSRRSGG